MIRPYVPVTFEFSSKPTTDSSELPGAFYSSLGLVILVIGILGGALSLWDPSYSPIIPSARYAVIPGSILILFGLQQASWNISNVFGHTWAYVVGVALIFFSDWLCHSYNFYQGPSIRGEILLGALICFPLLTKLHKLAFPFLICSIAILFYSFFNEAAGRLLVSDDHASFVYRLIQLNENFPNIPFYNPLWNAGFDSRDFFATGALSVYLLFYPLIKLFTVEASYNFIVACSICVLVPFSIYLAARFAKCSHFASTLSAILSLGISLIWFRWALKYGTFGFLISMSFLPLNIVLFSKFLSSTEKFSRGLFILFFITLSLTVLWPASAIMLAPLLVLGLIKLPVVIKDRSKLTWLIIFSLAHLTWIGPFVAASNLHRFFSYESVSLPETDIQSATLTNDINSNETKLFKSRSRRVTFDSALKHLRENAVSANPLILFFALPGLFLIPEKQLRRVFGSTGAWFLIAGGILYTVKPQLEFDRMLVILLLVFCVPAGKALERIFQHSAEFLLRRLAAALVAGFIFALPFTVSGIFQNRSVEQYYFGSQLLQELPKALKEFGGDGRILFSGFVLQDISGGHAAPLAAWSEKPLITSAFYHTQWWYTDVIPESFRNAGADGIRDFLNLYNVTAIAAHEPFWKHYFRSQPSEYNEVWHYENFVIFQRLNYESNYFVSGQGHVLSQSSHQVRMKLSSDTAIIKFNYYPFVKVEGCKVTPIEPSVGVRFTKLENCPTNVELTMESTSPWGRVLGNE